MPFNFLYAKPRSGIERLTRYMVATELGHASLIGRHFDWTANVLWAGVRRESAARADLQDVPGFGEPSCVAVVLSADDAIVPVARVDRYLRNAGMRTWRADGGGLLVAADTAHGQSLMSRSATLERIFAWLARG